MRKAYLEIDSIGTDEQYTVVFDYQIMNSTSSSASKNTTETFSEEFSPYFSKSFEQRVID